MPEALDAPCQVFLLDLEVEVALVSHQIPCHQVNTEVELNGVVLRLFFFKVTLLCSHLLLQFLAYALDQ